MLDDDKKRMGYGKGGYLQVEFMESKNAFIEKMVDAQLKDAKNNNLNKNNLKNLGGKLKVPCLRIENGKNDIQWLYESKEIINYLETEFKLTTN